MGIPQYEMRSSVLIAIMNITLSIILIIKLGFIGALLGTTLSGTLGSFYFIYSFHRRIKESLFLILKRIYANPFFFCVIALIASFVAGYIFKLIFPESPTNRIEAFYHLLINGAVFLGVYLISLFKSGYIDKYDKEIFFSSVELIKSSLRRKK